jgi:hypothetical protein
MAGGRERRVLTHRKGAQVQLDSWRIRRYGKQPGALQQAEPVELAVTCGALEG